MKTIAICNACLRTFDYFPPFPNCREEFHYCSKDDCYAVAAENHAKNPDSLNSWRGKLIHDEDGRGSRSTSYFEVPKS